MASLNFLIQSTKSHSSESLIDYQMNHNNIDIKIFIEHENLTHRREVISLFPLQKGSEPVCYKQNCARQYKNLFEFRLLITTIAIS